VTTAVELFDAAGAACTGRAIAWWARQPPVLWLTSDAVTVAGRSWHARHHAVRDGRPVHGFTPRQAAQIRQALLPVLAEPAGLLAEYTRHMLS
jgi:hypothetical protein